MEWLKNKSLKQSFLIISLLYLLVGLLFSAGTVMLCAGFLNQIESYPNYKISLDESGDIIKSENMGIPAEQDGSGEIGDSASGRLSALLYTLQIVLPVFCVILSLVLADITFYRIKLKKPLAILQRGTERIQMQDLDFEIPACADDEIGLLCSAFEKMRAELLKNNRELWRQIEERKRLNAAFSHDLRNPVTVLKGSAALLQKGMAGGNLDPEGMEETVSMIAQYTERIEDYIEAMTAAQKLEEWKCTFVPSDWSSLTKELKQGLSFLNKQEEETYSGPQQPSAEEEQNRRCEILFHTASHGTDQELFVDKSIVTNVAENLVSNALRYAKTIVNVEISIEKEKLKISVLDDGRGFSPVMLQKGIRPFFRDSEAGVQVHFGMGLYVCRLLCEKHGGSLEITNSDNGAEATAYFKITKS